jgi:hypothetical protein
MADVPFKKKAKDGDIDGNVQDGTEFERPSKVKGDFNKTALFSTRSLYWPGVGRLINGYNIVTDTNAEKWMTLKGIRVATPEEVAREYGV